jgi:cob(I)alamin adenosyltransferase
VKIYTKQGDQGYTSLYDGKRVSKTHLRIETTGHVDETNSILGLAIADCKHAVLKEVLLKLQHDLFDLGADLARPLDSPNAAKTRRIDEGHIVYLEREIDAATEALPPLKRFILPGGGITAARLHLARTVCRRAERSLVTLMADETLGDAPLIYLNRLSDLLFTLARLANQYDGIKDIEWEPGK